MKLKMHGELTSNPKLPWYSLVLGARSLKDLTLESPLAFLTKGKITGITDPGIMAAILLSIMVVLYVIFN